MYSSIDVMEEKDYTKMTNEELLEEYKKYAAQTGQVQQEDKTNVGCTFTAMVIFIPILISCLLGWLVNASCGWFFFGFFNGGMATYITASTMAKVFMMKTDATNKFAFWMLYFILMTSLGISVGIGLL